MMINFQQMRTVMTLTALWQIASQLQIYQPMLKLHYWHLHSKKVIMQLLNSPDPPWNDHMKTPVHFLDIEREKLTVMRKANEIAEKRLQVKVNICHKIDQISAQIKWMDVFGYASTTSHDFRSPVSCKDVMHSTGVSDEPDFMINISIMF